MAPGSDPVRARRLQAGRWAAAGKRAGYGLLGVAIVAFAIGRASGLTDTYVTVIVASLAAASVLLIPAIIVGYGVRAAEREDPVR